MLKFITNILYETYHFLRHLIITHIQTIQFLNRDFTVSNLSFLSHKDYLLWKNKFKHYLNDSYFPEHHQEIISYFAHLNVICLKKEVIQSSNSLHPICISMIKNDLERVKLFFKHYRNIGIKHFAIIDNDSTDGTLEWLLQQSDADIYQMKETFSGTRKNAFISRVIQIYGPNRWYLVVDSDELLSYSGMEKHNINEVVQWAETNGFKALRGYMVDMYSTNNNIDEYVTSDEIEHKFNLFDSDSYQMWNIPIQNTVWGGPRQRVWNLQAILMKMPLFYFSKNTLYITCHYLFPIIPPKKSPYIFALRHYKFLGSQDEKNYKERAACGNFYNGSTYYQPYLNNFTTGTSINFVYDKKQIWNSSNSINQLPFLHEINFNYYY